MRAIFALLPVLFVGCASSHCPADSDGGQVGSDADLPIADSGGLLPDVPVVSDSGPAEWDAGPITSDAGMPAEDATMPELDAGTPVSDAGPITSDAGTPVGGTLFVEVTESTPDGSCLLGMTGLELLRGRAVARDEGANVIRVPFAFMMLESLGLLRNLRLLDARTGVQYGVTHATVDASGMAVFDLISTFNVTVGEEVEFKVVADITSYVDGGISGTAFAPGIVEWDGPDGLPWVQAYGVESGDLLVDGRLTFGRTLGNGFTCYRTHLTVARHSSSPAGVHTGTADQTVAMYVFANSANVGNYSATVEGFAPRLNSTITTSASRTIRVWKDAVGLADNLLGEYVVPAGEALDTLSPSWYLSLTLDVFAGSSRTVYVTADTQDARADNRLMVELPVASVAYSDGVSHGINPESLPVAGVTLTY